MTVSDERAELRGLNSEGLKRRGYSVKEVGVIDIYIWSFMLALALKRSFFHDDLTVTLGVNLKLFRLRAAYRMIFMAVEADSGGIEARIAELEKNDELAQVPVVRWMQSIRDSLMDNRRGICKF
ncbi:putative acyl-[acyl-carrier-protein]--UDP-N-acetylglucosamine O-acyltransferase, mitochondrial [Drosera capensis]